MLLLSQGLCLIFVFDDLLPDDYPIGVEKAITQNRLCRKMGRFVHVILSIGVGRHIRATLQIEKLSTLKKPHEKISVPN